MGKSEFLAVTVMIVIYKGLNMRNWYKDAVFYELSVKAFCDANGDGIGDFVGLTGKLDYLKTLGVTCLWILPFFQSPMRYDGYDISDYRCVDPSYGTMVDFQNFLFAAHDRGLRVIADLVVNHTSDQHTWFQKALEDPTSPYFNYYVWSESPDKYQGARIIFTDTEQSNWTYSPRVGKYYWHRFFSHQPDLNFANPHVQQEVFDIVEYWLDIGLDGFRVDAVPYLFEAEGTNSENLPKTHVFFKRLRQLVDEKYLGRVLLAEANQWTEDVRPYFGHGDEFHMAFNFPVMPRLYMALAEERSVPIVNIVNRTPSIPKNCQWCTFLRNHDELTLEMVTDEERELMFRTYAPDPRMRLNLGIRRRLAPLMDNDRRRIELLNGLLLSLPGSPILYYGDEIGMGDNIALPDRMGLRAPMQWTSGHNADFSEADPSDLYTPVINDAVYGYQILNVESQKGDPTSLYNWLQNLIWLRKARPAFAHGAMQIIEADSQCMFTYVRSWRNQYILCVYNLSHLTQTAALNLRTFVGYIPLNILTRETFPPVGNAPYKLTLAPYSFYWLKLQTFG